jgi:GTP-binding protein EngB required for normal cell division
MPAKSSTPPGAKRPARKTPAKDRKPPAVPACNVMIVGITGAGKSTLVNALVGDEVARTGVGKPVTEGFYLYSSPPMTLLDSRGFEQEVSDRNLDQIIQEIDNRALSKETAIHMVWLCIESTAPRLQSFQEKCIERISDERVPVMVVITQVLDTKKANDLAANVAHHCPKVGAVAQIRAKEMEAPDKIIPPHGLEALLEKTASLFETKGHRAAFINAQRASLPLKVRAAEIALDAWIEASETVDLLARAWQQGHSRGSLLPIREELSEALGDLSDPFGGGAAKRNVVDEFVESAMENPVTRSLRGAEGATSKAEWRALASEACRTVGLAFLDVCTECSEVELNTGSLTEEHLAAAVRKSAGPSHMGLPREYDKLFSVGLHAMAETIQSHETDQNKKRTMRKRIAAAREFRSLPRPDGLGIPAAVFEDLAACRQFLSDGVANEDVARWLLVDWSFPDPFPPSGRAAQLEVAKSDRDAALRYLADCVGLEDPNLEVWAMRRVTKSAAKAHVPRWKRQSTWLWAIGVATVLTAGAGAAVAAAFVATGAAVGIGAAGTLAAVSGGSLAIGGATFAGGTVLLSAAAISGAVGAAAVAAASSMALVDEMTPEQFTVECIKLQTAYSYALSGPSKLNHEYAKALRDDLDLLAGLLHTQGFQRFRAASPKDRDPSLMDLPALEKGRIAEKAVSWMDES